jgi:hypothetical protein
MSERKVERRLATILAADVVGYSQLQRPADRELFLSGLRIAVGEPG